MRHSPVFKWVAAIFTFAVIAGLLIYPPAQRGAREIVGRLSLPVLRPFSIVASASKRMLQSAISFLGAYREVKRLAAFEEALLVEKSENLLLKEQIAHLRNALGVKESLKRAVRVSEVLGTFYENREEFLIIRQIGSAEITEGVPVLSSGGVMVGVVRAASPDTATVRLLSSPSETATVMIEPAGARGVLRGDNNGEYVISLIAKETEVQPGDVVTISGSNFSVPPRTPVGSVVSVGHSPTESFLEVRARSPFDVNALLYVTVVLE